MQKPIQRGKVKLGKSRTRSPNHNQKNGAEKLTKLNLGCGQRLINPGEDFIGIDICPEAKPDIVHDLRIAPWPFLNDSVDEVVSFHFLEHLDGFERIDFFNELYRVMKAGAKARFQVPYWSSMRAIQDPTHKFPPLCEASFCYMNKGWRVANKLDHYKLKCDFDFEFGYQLEQETATRSQEVQYDWVKHKLNAANDIIVTMTKRDPNG